MSTSSKILIVGCPKSGKHALINGLSHLNQFHIDKIHEEKFNDAVFTIYPYTLKNKYFKAEIDLYVSYDDSVQYTKDLFEKMNLVGCQAVLYVFDMTRMETYRSCVQLHETISSYLKSVDCQLLVGSHQDCINDTEYENIRSELINWCIDNAFEFVPSNLLKPLYSKDVREKEGVARVSECLDCVMWENLDRLTGESSQEKEEEITPIHEIVEAPKVICNYCKKVQTDVKFKLCSRCKTTLYVPLKPMIASYCSRECQVADWKNHKLTCKPAEESKQQTTESNPLQAFDQRVSLIAYMSPEQIIRSTMTEEEKKQEDDMNDFLKIMMKARQTKQEAASLPDKERKERAARMTMEIMKHLGLTGDNDNLEKEFEEIQKDLEKDA